MFGHAYSTTVGYIPGAEEPSAGTQDAPTENNGIEGSDLSQDAGPDYAAVPVEMEEPISISVKLHACINCKKSKVSCATQRPCPRCVRLQVREARMRAQLAAAPLDPEARRICAGG